MQENINTGETGTATPENEPVFTQGELNRVVSDRLHKERVKIETDLEKREQDLAKREFTYTARGILEKRHFHYNTENVTAILDVLNVTDADGLEKALDIIDKAAGRTFREVGTNPARTDWISNSTPAPDIRGAMGLKKG